MLIPNTLKVWDRNSWVESWSCCERCVSTSGRTYEPKKFYCRPDMIAASRLPFVLKELVGQDVRHVAESWYSAAS